ncbi:MULTISPECIES: CHAT domain-containing tetratricopeptide repeat protein [unclassified Microcoleus]|uniref:CHAT domain-containing tetratricopeptide repeat protein n=1 Tax=unclassified Microcoleus TaxID=2642155 RepID=UPI002FD5FAB0
MNEERHQAYLTLIQSLLTCPSDEETAILQANLELLDDDFARYLREWATQILGNLDADQAYNRAKILYNLNQRFSSFQQGSRASNIEIAIACLDIGLTIFTREAYSEKWAMFQNSLGIKYGDRIKGERGENIERAIAFYEAALQVGTRDAFPQQWAMTQYNLAIAYRNRIKGERGENLERAIAFYEAALQVYTRDAFPQQWAMTQNNLAIAYRNRIKGERGENIERAIAFYEAALQVYTRHAFPEYWAMTQNNLAAAYYSRIKGERGENIERAIAFFEAASEVYTRDAFPQDWAMTQHNLAAAYYSRIKGERGENLERAIAFYEAALQVRTRDAFPQNWATTQNNLANAYCHRIKGERGENLERAIACYELALKVRTRAAFPQDWADTQNNLAEAYINRIREDKAENIEKAIACCDLALLVRTRAAFPQDWAMTQNNLAEAYQKKGLIPEAIKCFELSLEIFKPDTLPLSCLEAARSLGNLGFAESVWETAIFGYEKAIEAVEQSREWITSDNRKREIIEENLDVYEKMMQSCINHQQYDKALQTIERSKSRYLVELFTNSEIYPKTATETEKQQLQNLRRQIAASQQLLETETPFPPPESGGEIGNSGGKRTTQTRSQSPESSQQQQTNLATALQQLEQFLETFKQREPEFKLTQKVQPIDIGEFQKTLDPKTAIIEWYIGNSNSPLLKGGWGGSDPSITTNNSNSDDSWGGSAFIITRDNIELVTYTTTQIAQLETWKNNYLEQYRGDEKQNRIWQHTLSTKLQKLSEILQLNEIVAHIPPDCQQLILVPHRYLHLFPLHALEFTSEGGHGGTAPTRYLLDCFPNGVKYAPSLQLLKLVQTRIKTRTSPPPEHQPLFAIQNPTEDLSNADMEVATIKTRFTSHDILINKQATKIAFTENRETISNASYIHFACHGLFNFDNPLLSLLALADSIEQTNNQNADDRPVIMRDGRKAIPEKCLTLQEIFAELNLSQCRLVTLSACETGLTDSIAITDEYIGLPSGFLYAGSLNVVSTLWSVDDLATAIFMIKFYQELHHERFVAVAVNAAQNWMRAVSKQDLKIWVESLKLDETWMTAFNKRLSYWPEDKPPFRNPKFWAAFCATGY